MAVQCGDQPAPRFAGCDAEQQSCVLQRFQRLQAALNRDQAAYIAATLGRTCDVLIERAGKLPGQMLGKSPWLQSVYFEGDVAVGDMVTVELTEGGYNAISARLLAPVPA